MLIHDLSAKCLCNTCGLDFRASIPDTNITIHISKLHKEVKKLGVCMFCRGASKVDILHVSFKERPLPDKKEGNMYSYTIFCGVCDAQWDDVILVPEGKYFADVQSKVLHSKCITGWCGNSDIMSPEDYAKQKKIIACHRIMD